MGLKKFFLKSNRCQIFPLQIYNFSALSLKRNEIAVESVQTHQEFLAHSRILKISSTIKNYSNENQRLPVSLIFDEEFKKEILLDISAGQTISEGVFHSIT